MRLVANRTFQAIFAVATLLIVSQVQGSHIDDTNGELSNFSFDRVVFRLQKDCGLDKIPDIKYFLEEDGGRYPDLDIYLSEGEPRFELSKNGKVVDTVRVGRYDLRTLRKLLESFGLKRDESLIFKRLISLGDIQMYLNL